MQATDLLKYIKNPNLLDKQSTTELQKLVNDFPYFQAAHLLLSMSAKKWDASIYQQSLKKTAIVATNRAHLFQLIHNIENSIVVEEEIKIVTEEKEIELKNTAEDIKHELDILKATDVVTEIINEEIVVEVKKTLTPEEVFEKEIEKEVVESFIETEVLKTQEFYYPVSTQEQPENFSDWLLFLKKNNGQPYQKIEEKVIAEKEKNKIITKREKNKALIDKIIDSNPGLIRNKEEPKFYAPDTKAKESLIENEHLVTETLAKIYALQGSVNKAVRAYEILSLKFPQKSAYFASLIQKLKNNQ
ncbi:MAG: hypothetical protein Q7W45_05310 [Bacteroidota bacterium]|nr:hypothetical protein [Bacteroidota bacterium]MDP3144866.1 hypothetical protein [Bacteroidota bacterium]MDP3557126.1 hypothetical protein [Bacteroidota bacterium]